MLSYSIKLLLSTLWIFVDIDKTFAKISVIYLIAKCKEYVYTTNRCTGIPEYGTGIKLMEG